MSHHSFPFGTSTTEELFCSSQNNAMDILLSRKRTDEAWLKDSYNARPSVQYSHNPLLFQVLR